MKDNTLFVCLGNWMDETAQLNEESRERVMLVIELLRKDPGHVLFTGWPYRQDCDVSIAKAMAAFFHKECPGHTSVFLDEVARDTVGDAVCARLWSERSGSYSLVHVVTSSYHVPRTHEIFRFVFSNKVTIQVSGAGPKSSNKVPQERESLLAFRETFRDVEAGDLLKILNRLISAHPYYNGEFYPKMSYDHSSKALVPSLK